MAETTHGVVLGGGLAGLLAARALSDHVDRVTIVERDTYPDGPGTRKGAPQGRHAHILWSGGAAAIEQLLPGTSARLHDAGAHRIGVKRDMVLYSPYGWQHRFPASHYAITCSRPLLDWTIRTEVLRDSRITVLQDTGVEGLTGSAERVTGARVCSRDGDAHDLTADLVVDATGRGSRLKHWLSALNLPAVAEETVDTGLTYATRVFRVPDGAPASFPVVSVYADHRTGKPGRNGLVLPIEDGQWIVTLSGTRGAEPTAHEADFADFAHSLRHPIVADLIAGAEPLTPVRVTRSTLNRRLLLERMAIWPEGLVALGDAVVSLNPIHGHGMSVAAQSAARLAAEIRRVGGLKAGLTRTLQRDMSAIADAPWLLSTSQDICYPDAQINVSDPRLTVQAAQRQRFADMVAGAALVNQGISDALTGVTTLTEPLASLEKPEILGALRQGIPRPPLTRPPLTAAEVAVLPGYEAVPSG